MELPYSDCINIGHLTRLFDNTSECYKLFWFKAIVTAIDNGKQIITYEELIDKMIADAWYMVTEYHLRLGPRDSLQAVIESMNKKNPELKSSEKESVIIDYLASVDDKEILKIKKTLTRNVPYRLQSPFLTDMKGDAWKMPAADLATRINQSEKLIYYFEAINGLSSRIIVNDDWVDYIKKNREIILGWIEYHMIHYLQRHNPSVPGIADKLYPPHERKLEKVKKFWKMVLSVEPVCEIYNNQLLTNKNISIDHFVPWSYVAHDELWNLNPTTRRINSSKSNNLPDWELYFPKLAQLEYHSYKLIWKYDDIHKEFDKCAKKHINNIDIQERIYSRGLSMDEFTKRLDTVIHPIYNAACECGFDCFWEYKD